MKLITSTHLLVYVYVKTARLPQDGKGEPKYEATIVIPKDHPDVQRIDDAIAAVYESEKGGKFKGLPITSRNFQNPLKDGDEYLQEYPDAPEQYAGSYFMKAKSTSQPKLWDAAGQDILDIDEEIYSGVFGRADITLWPFDNQSKGITVFLNSIKKTKDGERLAGATANVSAFDDEEDATEGAAPKRPTRQTPPARGAAPAKPKPAPAKPKRIYDEDAEGNAIWSDDDGENWFY